MLMPESVHHSRVVYNFLDLVGDLGGVLEVILVVFGFFFNRVSEHSYVLTALNKLFLVRTSEPTLFNKLEKKKKL